MKNFPRIVFVCFVFVMALLTQMAVAQNAEVPQKDKVVINGKVFYLHKVQKSEGLYRISVNYGVSQKEILEANPEAVNGLKEGQLLKIPVISGRNSTAEELNAEEFIYHTVEPGQTVFYISQKYKVAEELIYKHNPGSDKSLVTGSIIKFPKKQNGKPATPGVKAEKSYVLHTVKPKESLFGLSRQYGVSIEELIQVNPVLKSGVLTVGSVLRIPAVDTGVEVSSDDTLEDQRFLYHRIEAGDTFFSVSRRYGLKVDELQEANPGINADDLPLGFVVRVPKDKAKQAHPESNTENLFVIHKAQKKEGLYAISRQYNVDMQVLREVNDDIDFERLKKGTEIKVPNRHWFAMRDALLNEQDNEPVTGEETPTVVSGIDCNGYTYKYTKPFLKVAVLLPFNVEASKSANIVQEEKNGEKYLRELDEKVVSRRSKVFIEFYQGTLLAVDSLKKQGVNMQLYVYDTAPDTNKVRRILNKAEMASMDLIIGPAYAQNLPMVSDYSKKHGIPMVFPFSTINTELDHNPHLFQAVPIDSLLFETMADKVVESASQRRLIIIHTENKANAYEQALTKVLRDKMYLEAFRRGVVPDYVEYTFKQDDLASLEGMLDKTKGNVVVIPSIEEAQVNRIITTLKGAQSKSKADIELWGLPEWLKYQTVNPEDIHRLNGHIFSYYAVDYTVKANRQLIDKYRRWFKTEPMPISPYFQNATVSSNMSRYSLWGYDVSYYFLSALVKYGPQFEHCITSHRPFHVQSALKFDRVSSWGGFHNNGLYILNFAADNKLRIKTINK